MNRLTGLRVAALSVLVAGCARKHALPVRVASSPPAEPTTAVSAPFDLAKVMNLVRLSFHKSGGQYSGGVATYAVRVENTGAWSIAPRRLPAPASPHAGGPRQSVHAQQPVIGVPLEVGASRVSIGGAPAGLGTPKPTADAQLIRSGQGVVEHLRNTEHGVEQSWDFAARPGGAVEVQMQVSGLSFAGASPRGLHFIDPGSGLGVRYGAVTWIDALGKKTPIAARFADGAIRIEVAEDLLRRSRFPATLDPLVGPELGMDRPLNGPSEVPAFAPQVAYGGGEYLVVWSQGEELSTTGIHGTRVSSAGVVLDSTGIAIASDGQCANYPSVGFDGTNFLVAWGCSLAQSQGGIRGVRVSAAGAVLDSTPISIAAGNAGPPAIAFDGTNYLLTWLQFVEFEPLLYAARVTPGGAVLDTPAIHICTSKDPKGAPTLAFDGTHYLVTWEEQRYGSTVELFGARVTTGGNVLDPSGFHIASTGYNLLTPGVAFDGTNYLVTYVNENVNPHSIVGVRVAPSASLLDPQGIAIWAPTSSYVESFEGTAVAFDGSNYLVAWAAAASNPNNTEVIGARVSTSGAVIDPSGLTFSAASPSGFAIASDGTNFFLGCVNGGHAQGLSEILGMRIAASGAVLDANGLTLSRSANAQLAPAAAFDGTNYLVVWSDYRGDLTYDVYGARISPAGAILDSDGIAISTAAGDQVSPALAFDGTNYLVVWYDSRSGRSAPNVNRGLYGARVSPAGTVLDPSGIPISTTVAWDYTSYKLPAPPAVAFEGSNFLVAWADPENSAVSGVRIAADGSVLDAAPIAIASNTGAYQLSLGFDGTNSLVVWQAYNSRILGSRVTPAGAVLDASAIAISPDGGRQHYDPAVAFDGTNYLVVWSQFGSADFDVHGARVSPGATVLDPAGIAISTAAHDQRAPRLAFDGTNYLVAWQDNRRATADVYGARVTPAGTVLEPSGFAIAAGADPEATPFAASGGQGNALVAYARLDSSSAIQSWRARARFVAESGSLACTADSDCASGHCVDSVCCDTACGGNDPNDCMACSVASGGRTDGTCTALVDGAACDDGNRCNEFQVCESGACVGTAITCTAEPCESATCDPATGACVQAALTGTPCDDGNACTANDTCQDGICTGGTPLSGPTCDDGDACTQNDTCQNGTCVGGGQVICAQDQNTCTDEVCLAWFGCYPVPVNDGTACAGGTCVSGVCEVSSGSAGSSGSSGSTSSASSGSSGSGSSGSTTSTSGSSGTSSTTSASTGSTSGADGGSGSTPGMGCGCGHAGTTDLPLLATCCVALLAFGGRRRALSAEGRAIRSRCAR